MLLPFLSSPNVTVIVWSFDTFSNVYPLSTKSFLDAPVVVCSFESTIKDLIVYPSSGSNVYFWLLPTLTCVLPFGVIVPFAPFTDEVIVK